MTKSRMKVAAIIPAAGQGVRMGGGVRKQFLELMGRPILAHTLSVFETSNEVDSIILVTPEEEVAAVRKQYQKEGGRVHQVVVGGRERQDSVANGLAALGPDFELVMVHDGVRPFVTHGMIQRSLDAAREFGAALCAIPLADTLKRADSTGKVETTVDRQNLWRVQTPQTFQRPLLEEAFQKAKADQFYGTDEGMLVERIGRPVQLVEGSEWNIKITRPEDLLLGEKIAELVRQQREDV